MDFKFALVLAAVAFCAVQAASVGDHERNRRDAADLFNKAKSFVSNMLEITNGAKNAMTKLNGTLKKIGESSVRTAQSALQEVGLNVDKQGFVNILKGNFESCDISADIKTEALDIRTKVNKCIEDKITEDEQIIQRVTDLANAAEAAFAVISKALTTVCVGEGGESSARSACANVLRAATEGGPLADFRETLVKDVKKATSLVANAGTEVQECVADRLEQDGPTVVNVAKSLAAC